MKKIVTKMMSVASGGRSLDAKMSEKYWSRTRKAGEILMEHVGQAQADFERLTLKLALAVKKARASKHCRCLQFLDLKRVVVSIFTGKLEVWEAPQKSPIIKSPKLTGLASDEL